MTDRSLGRRKSQFPANTIVPPGTYFDFVVSGVNYRIKDSDFYTALGVTGTIVQDGDPLAVPVLDIQGTVNNIRNLEFGAQSGLAGSVSPQNGIALKLDAQVPAGSGVAVLDSNNKVRHIKAGSNAAVSLSGDDIVIAVSTTLVGLSESALINTVREFNAQQYMGADPLVDGATITWDLDTDPIATITLGGDRTLNFINAKPGGTYVLQVIQDGTGTRLINWSANIQWEGGIAPTLSTTAGADDLISFVSFDTVTLKGVVGGLDFA